MADPLYALPQDELLGFHQVVPALCEWSSSLADRFVYVNGRQYPKKTTAGWHLCVEWKDGSSSWQTLKSMKESYPVEVAEYAIATVHAMARAMLLLIRIHWQNEFNASLWPCALDYAAYVHNNLPFNRPLSLASTGGTIRSSAGSVADFPTQSGHSRRS